MADSTLDKLLDQRAKLDARINAKKARLREQERKRDTRRKIIAGALAIEHAANGNDDEFTLTFFRLLNRYVDRPTDRALFDLPPKDGDASNDPLLRDSFGETGDNTA